MFLYGSVSAGSRYAPFRHPKGRESLRKGLFMKRGREAALREIQRGSSGQEEPKSCGRVLLEQTGTAELAGGSRERKHPRVTLLLFILSWGLQLANRTRNMKTQRKADGFPPG